jgi:hypothetical protein
MTLGACSEIQVSIEQGTGTLAASIVYDLGHLLHGEN